MSTYHNFYGGKLQRYYAGLPDLPKSDGLFVNNATELMQIESRAKRGLVRGRELIGPVASSTSI